MFRDLEYSTLRKELEVITAYVYGMSATRETTLSSYVWIQSVQSEEARPTIVFVQVDHLPAPSRPRSPAHDQAGLPKSGNGTQPEADLRAARTEALI